MIQTKWFKNLTTEEIHQVGQWLREGELVALPTETVYGLGANGLDIQAMDRIYAAKGRPSDNPLILHVSGSHMVPPLVESIPEAAKKLMEVFWPGPLTILFTKSEKVPFRATGGLAKVALRCPKNDVTLAIIEECGVPIAAPSANISGRPSPTRGDLVYDDMAGKIKAIVDTGPCPIGIESTIIDLEGSTCTILRPGAITEDMLRPYFSTVVWDKGITNQEAQPKAPGMKYKHYAPQGEMTTYIGDRQAIVDTFIDILATEREAVQRGSKRIAFLVTKDVKEALLGAESEPWFNRAYQSGSIHLYEYDNQSSNESLGSVLYSYLLKANKDGITHIFSQGPQEDSYGKALLNRMSKASSGRVIYLEKRIL